MRFARSARRGRGERVSRLALRRAASSVLTFALGVSLLGTCPCVLLTADDCSAQPRDRAGRAASCCEESTPAPSIHSVGCCEGPARGDRLGVTPTLGAQGPASILDMGPGNAAPVLAASAPFDGVRRPPLVRLGGPPILRI